MFDFLKFWALVLKDAWEKFNKDDGWAIASHVALSGLFALFPFLIFATAIAAFFELDGFAETIVSLIFDTWPSGAGEPIANEIKTILTVPRSDILTLGGLLTLYFASNGVEAARVALNRSYRQMDKRAYWYLRLQSLAFVIISIIVLFLITFMLVLLPLGWNLAQDAWKEIIPYGETVWFWRTVITLSIILIALIASHLFLPAGKRTLFSILPGIVFTMLAWFLASIAFGMYLEQFADYVSTYAGLAGAMIGLLFLYLLGVIFIFGGEVNAAALSKREKAKNAKSK